MSRFVQDAQAVRAILKDAHDRIKALHPDQDNIAQAMLSTSWSTHRAVLWMLIRDVEAAIASEAVTDTA